MNISMCQRPDAISEVKELMTSNETFISSKDSSPMLTVKLDVMTGWYKLTYGFVPIPKHLFFDTISRLDIEQQIKKMEYIKTAFAFTSFYQTLKEELRKQQPSLNDKELDIQTKEKYLYSGYGLFSMLIPSDFEFEIDNKKSPDKKPVVLHLGIMLSGTLDKDALGSSSGSLLHHLSKDYGNAFASEFIMNLQCFINDTLQFFGFSCGMEDFVPHNRDEIDKVIETYQFKAMCVMNDEKDPYLREFGIGNSLNLPKEQGAKYAMTSLDEMNNLVVQVRSGSKGKWTNISEITSVVGQTFVGSKRIPKLFGGRSLSCFPRSSFRSDAEDVLPENYTSADAIRIFQSRGFIRNSYFNGLTPSEYFLAACGGREGLINTAVTTADTGYIQRKIAKILEDLQVSYVGTVNTPSQNIVQFSYGGDNIDAARLMKVTVVTDPNPQDKKEKKLFTFIDIGHVATKLNSQKEYNTLISRVAP